ncbi:hypothetical protein [Neobacillus massiliamazoniensis]|uniref:Glycosyltransferase n=1 Tax=Neobacillus massiliamazoniensis TaxID=1499688 RepID=A0A0U1NXR1_9BACI|nr:hypothetical protein [Neobacillus massiliamazoniensis]CRK82810.1 glycosyltransferase [Neobacillus massiliamazoniensis]
MSPVQIFQSLFNTESFQNGSLVSLKPGQLLYGRVEKFLPNDTAIIQIGNVKLLAHVKASLSTTDHYWFEVRSNGDDGIQLKVVEGQGNQPSHLLEEHFKLSETKITGQLLQSFLERNVPFTKEQLRTSITWINHDGDISQEITALEWMMKKDLPFTKQTFQSLVAVQESASFSSQLEEIGRYLEDPKFASFKTTEPLKQMIATIFENHIIDKVSTGTDVKQMLQSMVHQLGLEYEKEVKNTQKLIELHSLKPLLMSAIHELGTNGRELEPVLNRLTGMQLIAQDPIGQMQQMVMQLPISFRETQTDVTLQWSGRKTKNGKIDPDYCRILFYLDLQNLKQTVVDMQIQNKLIHVSVLNDTKEIESIVPVLTPTLKEKLENLGYKLSFIKVIPFSENKKMVLLRINSSNVLSEYYQGVDIKI